MRVDFLGSFQQVQKLIQARAAKEPVPTDFGAMMQQSEANKPPQLAESNQQIIDVPAIQKAIADAPKARYDFSKPEFLAPAPAAIEVAPVVAPAVKEPPISVKTPSGLSGRLVKIEDPFAGLDKLEKREVVARLVSVAGAEHGIDPALSLGVIKAESNFNPIAVSSDGYASKGLMQLLDSTGKEMMGRLGVDQNYTPFDPEQNIDLGVGYLARLHNLFQSSSELGGNLKTFAAANSSSLEKLAVAAYNAGEGRVASAQQRANRAGKDPSIYENVEAYLPETTREYVKRVLSTRNDIISSSKG